VSTSLPLIQNEKFNMAIQVFKPKYRTKEVLKEIEECLEIGWTGLGFKTEKFEEAWKKYTDFENAHFVASNTVGLQIALKVLKDTNKWKNSDEIITTPLTFVSSNHSILYNNLQPVFADVDDQLCLDPKSVEARITKKTKAVMFVGLGGNIGQYNEIKAICDKHGLKLILDAAHMAGTQVDRVYHGVAMAKSHIGWDADVSVFSFQSVKNLPTADGGMICFKNKDYDALARKLSWLGIDKDTFNRTNSKGSYKWDYDVIDLGFKAHGNSIMASMGLVALKYLDEDNARRREICEMYDQGFKDNFNISSIPHNPNCISSRHLYQIKVPNRDQVMEFLNANDIFPGVHYKDNTQYEMYSYGQGTCPNAAKLSEEVISLPLHMFLTNEDIQKIIEVVKKAVTR
jgi:dTDP-4-amino-4,6-dideoxygalactose transaminase